MPCTAICQITGHRNWGAGKTAVYHQRLYPYAFLLPERATGYVQQRIAGRSPCPTETVVCDSRPVAEEYSIAFGHWASLEGKGTPEGIYALDTGCCWGGTLPACAGKINTILSSRRTGIRIWAKRRRLKHSLIQEGRIRRDRRRIRH